MVIKATLLNKKALIEINYLNIYDSLYPVVKIFSYLGSYSDL